MSQTIEDLQQRLMGRPTGEELDKLKVQVDILERLIALDQSDHHDHDSGGGEGNHDHTHSSGGALRVEA